MILLMQIDTPEALRTFYASVRDANGGSWPDFEPLIRRLYEIVLQPGDWAVDGGACAGLHTLPMADIVGTAGRVEAFEPVTRLARVLHLRCSRRGNITIRELALSNRSGEAEFLVAGEVAYSGLRPRNYPRSDMPIERIQVRVTTLDEIVPPDAPVRFIKLDLEGGEFDALRGAERLLAAQRPVVVFEYSRRHAPEHYGFRHEDMLAFFARLNYRLFDILGVDFDNTALWEASKVWYFTAWPREREPVVPGS